MNYFLFLPLDGFLIGSSGVSGHETNNEGKKRIKGGPKGPELEIIGLSELKKKIKEVKKRKTGLYHRLGKRSRKKVEAEV